MKKPDKIDAAAHLYKELTELYSLYGPEAFLKAVGTILVDMGEELSEVAEDGK